MNKVNHATTLSKEDLIARALESENAIAEKQFISLDELESEMRNC